MYKSGCWVILLKFQLNQQRVALFDVVVVVGIFKKCKTNDSQQNVIEFNFDRKSKGHKQPRTPKKNFEEVKVNDTYMYKTTKVEE